jgi:hypothetical protein
MSLIWLLETGAICIRETFKPLVGDVSTPWQDNQILKSFVLRQFYERAVRMKETVALEYLRYRGEVPNEIGKGLSDTNSRLAARPMLIWGEYGSQYASPACDAACSLYAPRWVGYCRCFKGADIVAIEVESWQDLQNQHLQMPIARVS